MYVSNSNKHRKGRIVQSQCPFRQYTPLQEEIEVGGIDTLPRLTQSRICDSHGIMSMCRYVTGCPQSHLIHQFRSISSIANLFTPVCWRNWLEGTRTNFRDMFLEPLFTRVSPLANVVPTTVPDVWWGKPRNFLWLGWRNQINNSLKRKKFFLPLPFNLPSAYVPQMSPNST